LSREWFARPTTQVARDLVGYTLVVDAGSPEAVVARIVETEAYLGLADPASHAFRGPTPRCAVMFGPPAHLYVYFTYGMHHCANVVTDIDGVAGAVLLRAASVEEGFTTVVSRRAGVAAAALDCISHQAPGALPSRSALGSASGSQPIGCFASHGRETLRCHRRCPEHPPSMPRRETRDRGRTEPAPQ